MKVTYQSKSGTNYDSAELALCDDAMHSDFQMFTETGEPCEDIELCDAVWCPTIESAAQFNELCKSAKHFLNCRFTGIVEEGLSRYNDCEDNWFLVGTPSAMADMSMTILNHIARIKREGKGE